MKKSLRPAVPEDSGNEATSEMSFSEKERLCETIYRLHGPLKHLCTPEDHSIIFTCSEDYACGTAILALCASLFRDIHIVTYELMSNHLHIAYFGADRIALLLFEAFRKYMKRYLRSRGRTENLRSFEAHIFEAESLENARNIVAYVNRNGFVVSTAHTPFSYPNGANRFYFNPEAKARFYEQRRRMTQLERQQISHSRVFDHTDGLYTVHGQVSPMCFCDIELGEALFRDAQNYFHKVSKSIESQKDIAKMISETVFYDDEELFGVAARLARERYGSAMPSNLDKIDKIDLAKTLHFDYNAGHKQLLRILKLDLGTLEALFPRKK